MVSQNRRRPLAHRRLFALLVSSGVFLAACGVPTSLGPRSIAKNQVPFGLLGPSAATPTTVPPSSSTLVPVQVFLVGPNPSLTAVTREVPVPAPLTAVLNALIAGPTRSETARGYSTAIPSGTQIISDQQVSGNVVMNFNATFGLVSGSAQVQAVAQIVFTIATQLQDSTGVLFEINGQPILIPIGSGALVPGPVYLLDFPSYLPPTS
jgi:hypothetical protein